MLAQLRSTLVMLVAFTALTGVLYPLAVTAIAQALVPDQANGSLIERDGRVVGSALVGQSFDDPRYFWGRPSATGPVPYNGAASSGSNLGPTNPALHDAVRARVEQIRTAHPTHEGSIPADLVTASGSGLDPDISPAAALLQAPRVAKERGLDVERVTALVDEHTQTRSFRVFGEPRVNVLRLNLALDSMDGARPVHVPTR
jgi:K+-transporting ATPase ATPase C chain